MSQAPQPSSAKLNSAYIQQLEQELEQLRHRLAACVPFRLTFEQAAVGIAHVDAAGRWQRVNQTLCDMLGYTCEELLQLTMQDLTWAEDWPTELDSLKKLLSGEMQTYSLEKRLLRKDETCFWVKSAASCLRETSADEAQDEPQLMIFIIEDIHDRKQAELALQERAKELSQLNTILSRTTALLEERNRELDRFAYIASHDLKAPLRAIANLSEWIEEDLQGQLAEEGQHQMRLLRSRVFRMEALIDGLLQYSRAGRTETAIDTISVELLLAEVIDSLAPPPGFSVTIQPSMPTLTTRALLLKQVFANLISNAIKHHDRPDGQITISVEAQGSFCEFVVADDGPGIASQNHSRIFDMFQTLFARDVKESTGIGLSIVKKIVEAEGGKVSLESALGQGSTFKFLWPTQPRSVAGDR